MTAKRTAPNGSGLDPTPPAAPIVEVSQTEPPGFGLSDTQARVRLDPAVIDEYAEAMTEGAIFPPVVLFSEGDLYWIGDGHHRIKAARQVGYTAIKAEVREGGQREALLYACGANASHGLRRTNADKRKAVDTMLRDPEWSKWSNGATARHCGATPQFVGDRRRVLETVSSDNGQRTYTTKHGTVATMDTSRIGTRAAPPAAARTPRRRAPQPTDEVPVTRSWYYFTAGLQQVIHDFARDGGVKPLLEIWTAEERDRARAQLAKHRDQIDRLEAAITAFDPLTEHEKGGEEAHAVRARDPGTCRRLDRWGLMGPGGAGPGRGRV
jgi:hypothetical protein